MLGMPRGQSQNKCNSASRSHQRPHFDPSGKSKHEHEPRRPKQSTIPRLNSASGWPQWARQELWGGHICSQCRSHHNVFQNRYLTTFPPAVKKPKQKLPFDLTKRMTLKEIWLRMPQQIQREIKNNYPAW